MHVTTTGPDITSDTERRPRQADKFKYAMKPIVIVRDLFMIGMRYVIDIDELARNYRERGGKRCREWKKEMQNGYLQYYDESLMMNLRYIVLYR